MAEAVVGATIQILLENLLRISEEQISLVRDFKTDLEQLKKSFFMVNDFLHDAEKRQVHDSAVKRWLRELEALAFDADNVFDEINYHLLANKKVQSFFACSNYNPITYRLKLGRRIKGINEKLKSVNQQATELSLQTRIANAQPPVFESPETDSFSADLVYGRENDMSRIVEKLIKTTGSPAEQVLSVLPIVGMGGLGKTTLARKVFGHEQIIAHFGGNRVWVHVPSIFDVPNILKNILASLTEEKFELETREVLLRKLQEHIGTERYMFVFDDVWNEDREMWGDFVTSLAGISSTAGNCMIVTSRSEVVASIVETLPVHKLESLSEDDCWSIIKNKAFNRLGYNPLELEAVGRNIAKRCRGLPLAAKVVGGLLCKKSKNKWLEIEKNWLSDFGDDQNPISKILKLSYYNLPTPSLKKCFAYCSIFPKGYDMEKENLIELWMAEGFLHTDQQRINIDIDMETIGSKIFNLLLQNSLLQVARSDDYGKVTHCNMHDLVHDLAWSILCENVVDGICQSRYIGCKPSGDGLLSIPEGKERYVRTLFFSGKVSDIRFSDFESLHSLTLRGSDIKEIPTSIRELKHLRYLDISETSITFLPDSIGELYHLQTLRAKSGSVQGRSNLKKLPDSLSYLISLRHLHTFGNTTLPREIGKLTSLRTLTYFHVGHEKGCGISELENLKDLKGKLKIDNLEKVCNRNEAMSADLIQKPNIYKLSLVWYKSGEGDEENDECVLEGLQPHSNLKSLEIEGFKGKSLPLWAVQLDGHNNLVEIKLSDCSECEELPMLGHLPHLKSLYLQGLTNVKSVRSSFYGIDQCKISRINTFNDGTSNEGTSVVVFRALERLVLTGMRNLEKWDEIDLAPQIEDGRTSQLNEVRVFPRLKLLTVYGCTRLVRLPSHFPCLQELNIGHMESSLALGNISEMKLTSLTRLVIRGIKGLECLPSGLFANNRNLSKLEISGCPKLMYLVPFLGGGGATFLLKELRIDGCISLRELPNDLHGLSSLEMLYITDCPELKSIPYPISSSGGGFISLRELCIWHCQGLTNLPVEMVQSCAPSLKKLSLRGLSSITNFPMVVGCLHRMIRLRVLVMKDVPTFSSKDIVSLSTKKLLSLEMGSSVISKNNDNSSWNNLSFNESVGAMLRPFISLRHLELSGMAHWEHLPDQLQHLSYPEELRLHNFGIETLPEWFGNLSSLKKLELLSFKKLRHLPSKIAMQRLSKLTHLEICDCPLLLKEKRGNNINNILECWLFRTVTHNPKIVDSEWPKICHIFSVRVD